MAAKRSPAPSGAWHRCRLWAPQQPGRATTLSGQEAISGQVQVAASGQIHLFADSRRMMRNWSLRWSLADPRHRFAVRRVNSTASCERLTQSILRNT